MAAIVTVPNIPVVTIFVRHSTDCRFQGDETYKQCNCRKHLRWSYGGTQYRQSAKTRSWAKAEAVKRQVEGKFADPEPGKPIGPVAVVESDARKTIERAIEIFVTSKRNSEVNEGVIKKYERELARLKKFFSNRSKSFPQEMTLEDLEDFRAEWKTLYPSIRTRKNVQTRLRGFLRYCYEHKWTEHLLKLSKIGGKKDDVREAVPLEDAEYKKVLAVIPNEFPEKAKKVRALVQLMRYSGLAIRDAVTLERNEIQHDTKKKIHRVVTNRQKTGTHVSVPIPPDVAKEVLAAQNGNPVYLFWNTGTGTEQSAVTNWQHDLRTVFRAAGLPEGHPHQLRHTFAVSLLKEGVPLEEVSKLLGHDSIRTTEKHYAKWVKARQDRLDSLVMATWKKCR